MRGKIYIGTSGWTYKSWEKQFYPKYLPAAKHLEFYTTQFPSVEINRTFYSLPTDNMVKGWQEKVPEGFVYSIKGSRYITHIKRLKELEGSVDRFFERIKPMQNKTGAVLWQLPPYSKKNLERLGNFLKDLPKDYSHAVEFRHESWLDEETYEVLRKHNAAFVSVSSLKMPMDMRVTAGFIYIRFHGLEGGAAHDYTREELEPWAKHICRQADEGKDCYGYFNNDVNVRAPQNAKLLMEMVGCNPPPINCPT